MIYVEQKSTATPLDFTKLLITSAKDVLLK